MAQHDKPILTGPRVTLRDARPDDVDARFALGNTPQIQAMFGADPSQVRDITREAAEFWVQSQINEAYAWIIEVGGALIGAIRLHTVNHADKRAQIAIGILDPDALGQGHGTEAMQLLSMHAFDTMGLHRLGCRVLDFNARAIASYEKVGFAVEGREREAALIGNAWHDDLMMGLLDRDLVRLG
ncbi:GNAT family protein [uncultured Tateyamaria sp.]|uniref:GNAT family N-acetyltransferase n=1 Tax=uncultured Tateyamaria sp. TaxID=455651 RepID=UPI002604BFB8|nr:GNAT family protein [uncultured Tateyamaria sp.]